MQTLTLKKRAINYNDFVRRGALESDYDKFISDDTILIDEDTGEILLVYAKLHDNDLHKQVFHALNRIRYDKTQRLSGLVTTSRLFGYSPRREARTTEQTCRAVSLVKDSPIEHSLICKYGEHIAKLYSATNEETYRKHLDLASKTLAQYRIPNSPFTSGIVNKNNPLKYHFDKGNFKGVYSAMVAFKHKCSGGHLSLPEYGVGLEIADQSVLMFDGQSILHGVTPIKKRSKDALRYTIVYYSLVRIWDCLPLDEEIANARKRRYQVELKRFKQKKQLQQKVEALDDEISEHNH